MDLADLIPDSINQIVSSLKTPYILKNFPLLWPIHDADFKSWCKRFDQVINEPFQFDVGSRKHADLPQWERFRSTETMTLSEFVDKAQGTEFDDKWASYSYKDINTWPEPLRKNIDFKKFVVNAADILFWIGSKGSNTPCHYDTYGFNIVVQVFGRKRWLLFPPDTPMDITRVPYEESSVYCKQNFYSPSDMKQFTEISDKCYAIELNPGDILIVPTKWWHYVECLEESLTINTWVPTEMDPMANLEECFVKRYITKTTKDLSYNLRSQLLNPNELTPQNSIAYDSAFLTYLATHVLDNRSQRHKRRAHASDLDKNMLSQTQIDSLLAKYSSVFVPIKKISRSNFVEMMNENSARHESNIEKGYSEDFYAIEREINSMCHPETIQVCSTLLLKDVEKNLENILS